MYSAKVEIFNVDIDNFFREEFLKNLGQGGIVFTPNIDHLMKLQKDSEFYHAYQEADYRVCDSQILYWFSHLMGLPIKEKLSGSDLLPAFCDYYRNDEEFTIFLLGAAPGVADKAAQRINDRLGRQMVIASHSPTYGFEKNETECLEIIEKVNQSKASVIAVGVGTPKQEKWIAQYKHNFKHAKVILAIGASIDFEAGFINRAPKWVSELGLEWLYRLVHEPKRLFRRYIIDDIPFFWLVLKQALGLYQYPDFQKPDVEASLQRQLRLSQGSAQEAVGR